MEDHISGDVHAARLDVIALIAFMIMTITEKNAFFRTERKLVRIIGT
jgi:hypothetical protein